MVTDYESVTELSGDDVSPEQVRRMAARYYWASEYAKGKDVLEVACGAGMGLGYLSRHARSVVAGDLSETLVTIARRHYRERIPLSRFDAERLPFKDGAFGVVILFEALYYIPDLTRFFLESRRVLRPGGVLLLATANKDLFDFNPSPHSYRYLGVVELHEELAGLGFETRCYGDTPVTAVGLRQRVLRPAKAVAARMGIIPRSMSAKKLLKRVVFGGLVPMPAELTDETAPKQRPVPLESGVADRLHKVIFCTASLTGPNASGQP